MRRKPKESSVEEYFVKRVESLGAECRKYKTRMHDPDRICLFDNGIIVFVELKRPGAVPRPGQIREHIRLRAKGFRVEVIDTKEGADEFVERMRREISNTRT